ncbi:MAG: serine/threonine-protein phosphatase [Methylococcales bacterium]|nr:serine/threonine-protein phosphatase [Methylococcales bacterium]
MNNPVWTSYGITHTGKVRKINQDNFLNLPDKQLWIVADGMGGHQAGELASGAIVKALESFEPAKTLGGTASAICRELFKVNRELVELASKNGKDTVIGSTVVVLLGWRQHCVCLWSGDSRIYLLRQGQLRQLTRDHNYESKLLDKGYSAEEIKAQPFTQSLTHAVGGEKDLFLEAQIQEIRPGDIFLLCSDGLNKEVKDSEIEAILKTTPIQKAADQLIECALNRGARDNVTVVAVQMSAIS